MELQAYMVVKTHACGISGWNIISRILHSCATYIGGMNDVKSYLATLEFNNRKQLEDFCKRINILQQEINPSRETVSPT